MIVLKLHGIEKEFKTKKEAVEEAIRIVEKYNLTLDDLLNESMSLESAKRAFENLKRVDTSKMWDGYVLKQKTTGVQTANYYQRHRYKVRNSNKLSPYENFKLNYKAVIYRCVFRLKVKKITASTLVSCSHITNGASLSGNFNPAVAKAIYERFIPEKGAKIVDISSGYGGRLVGAMSSAYMYRYHGTDPSTKTYEGLIKTIKLIGAEDRAFVLNLPFEDVPMDFIENADFVFTSPPYFSKEQYAYEPTQSFIRYPTYNRWLEGFLYASFQKAYEALKPGRRMVINIADCRIGSKAYPLERDTIRYAEKAGFTFVRQYKMVMARIPNSVKEKSEPFFEFIKEAKK